MSETRWRLFSGRQAIETKIYDKAMDELQQCREQIVEREFEELRGEQDLAEALAFWPLKATPKTLWGWKRLTVHMFLNQKMIEHKNSVLEGFGKTQNAIKPPQTLLEPWLGWVNSWMKRSFQIALLSCYSLLISDYFWNRDRGMKARIKTYFNLIVSFEQLRLERKKKTQIKSQVKLFCGTFQSLTYDRLES